MGWMTRFQFPAEAMMGFFFTTASRSTLGLTQLPIQMIPGTLFSGSKATEA